MARGFPCVGRGVTKNEIKSKSEDAQETDVPSLIKNEYHPDAVKPTNPTSDTESQIIEKRAATKESTDTTEAAPDAVDLEEIKTDIDPEVQPQDFKKTRSASCFSGLRGPRKSGNKGKSNDGDAAIEQSMETIPVEDSVGATLDASETVKENPAPADTVDEGTGATAHTVVESPTATDTEIVVTHDEAFIEGKHTESDEGIADVAVTEQ